MPMPARAVDLVEQILHASDRIFDRKWFSEHFAVTVTEHDQMILFGVIDGHTH